jgi:hypothetical protein
MDQLNNNMGIKDENGDISAYGKSIFKASHKLVDTGLFDDVGLIGALNRHPEENLDICTQGSFHTCNRGKASAEDILNAVKQGVLWLNLRRIEQVDSPLGHLIQDMHLAFEQTVGVKAGSRIGGLLISSPTTRVNYHFDTTDVTLWHLRGKKRIFIYPNTEPFIAPRDAEAIALATGVEKLPYQKSFDDHAVAVDLEPGDVISWPHLSPHRIDNQEGLNVSLSLESLTMASRLRMGTHFFNGYVNKTLKTGLHSTNPTRPIALAKTGMATFVKRTGLHQSHHEDVVPSYNLNMTAPGCIEPIGAG